MRLSALVQQQGLAPFNAEDVEFVSSKLAEEPERLILVGGQAVQVWGVILDVPAPTGDASPLTEDVDWLGGKRDAKWLCERLGGKGIVELQLAKDFEGSPSSALAYLRRPDKRILMMDFMRAIVGPSTEEIRKLGVPVSLKNGAVITVMHPLLCLESRFANLAVIPEKRTGNGRMQALWAIQIVQAYLRNQVDGGFAPQQVAKACRRVIEAAEYKHGRYCLLHFGLNPLDAVTEYVVSGIGGRFETEEWPRVLKRIHAKQAHWKEVHGRVQPQLRQTASI